MINTYGTMALSEQSIREFVQGINKTQFGLSAVCVTAPRLRAPKSCPYTNRVKKVTLYTGFTFACYANAINGASATHSGCTETFESNGLTWAHWVQGLQNVLLQSNKDASQYYLALTGKEANMTIKSTYLLDGKVATPEQMAELAEWLYQSKPSAKQVEMGIKADQVIWRLNPKLENVIHLSEKPQLAKAVYEMLTSRK